MAKIRIYELAKELEIDSKKLVEKLKAGGMKISNYMSTLDEKGVEKARDIITGSVSEVVEEKRIKPTVIRRRKKQIKIEPEKSVVMPDEEKNVRSEPEKQEPAQKKESPLEEAEAATIKKEKRATPKEEVKRPKKKKKGQPAKIIKMPEDGPLKDLIAKKKKAEAEKAKKDVPESPRGRKSVDVPKEDVLLEEKKNKFIKKKPKKKKKDVERQSTLRHRRVEVFERADLLDGRKKRRKDTKGAKKAKETGKKLNRTEITTPKAIKRKLKVQDQVTVAELSKAMSIKAAEFIKGLMNMGVRANINQLIDYETASVLADEFGYELELDSFIVEEIIDEAEDKPEDLQPRPPVVTIMGHVDHGKTSLLDYIRKSNIIGGESGGITQHIGAYYVKTDGGDVVFLDTPGHAAFTAMRARGAKVTDIIVLVVAADDGVMPQTKEAINHARAADIPIIVAVNKIDTPNAKPENVLRELAALELTPEGWGGDTIFVNISAKTGEGIDELLESVLLQAEILELKANPNKSATGSIIEAQLDKSKGSIATVLIKNGTLKQGDYFICGENYGRVRAMLNNRGKRIISASPSVPVEIYGISGVPMAGDEFRCVKDEKTAKQIIGHRLSQSRAKDMAGQGIVNLEDLYNKIKKGEIKELDLVLKADVQGSLEALSDSLVKLSTEEVQLKIIHSSTGAITETDVMLASASGAIIIGFNVRTNPRVTDISQREKVEIRHYDVIYDCITDVKLAMTGLLAPLIKEKVIGRAGIKELFHVPKIGAVAGCHVTNGYIERNAGVRLLREDVVIFDGKIASLRRFKEDVKEVQSGFECGISVENYQDIKPGDVFEVYLIEEVAAEL